MTMLFGHNKHGRYCVPEASAHRPAAQAILAGEVHEPDTIALIIDRARGRGQDVVTAGTYFGDFLPALHSAGVVFRAFEPNRSNWVHTIGTLYLNQMSDVRVERVALGEDSYSAKVVTTETLGEAGDQVFDLGGGSFVDRWGDHDCVVRPLDSLLPGDIDIGVIHLDVERYEERALAGAMSTIQRCHPTLILETVPWRWVNDNLAPLGYRNRGTVHNLTVFEGRP